MKINNDSTIALEKGLQIKQKRNNPDSPLWRDVVFGGVPGVLLGSAGTLFAVRHFDETGAVDSAAGASANIIPNDGSVLVASVSNDELSFSEAFAAARAEVGPGGVFVWHGDAYSTYYAEEWDSMSLDEKNEYAQAVANISDVSSQTTDSESYNEAYAANDDDVISDSDVRVLSEDTVRMDDGNLIDVVSVEVDGHYGEIYDINNDGQLDIALVDTNDDGKPDVALADVNGNGVIDENEVYDMNGDVLASTSDSADTLDPLSYV